MKLEKKINITVYGGFGSGKSSLINALLGEDILSTGFLPDLMNCSAPVEIQYGMVPRAVAYDYNGNIISEYETYDELKDDSESEYDFESHTLKGKYLKLKKVAVFYPWSVDKKWTITELAASEYTDNSEVLAHSDLIIYVMRSDYAYTREDEKNLRKIQETTDIPVILVANSSGIPSSVQFDKLRECLSSVRDRYSNIIEILNLSLSNKLENNYGRNTIEDLKNVINWFSLDISIQESFFFLERIIDTQTNSEEMTRALSKLKKRYEDPEFKLAVIGNFSAGKSTFLNALFGRELLSVSNLPTTAIPTYIRWNKNSVKGISVNERNTINANDPIIVIEMEDGSEYPLVGRSRRKFQKETGIELPGDIGEMIDYITTSSSLIGKIRKIEMYFYERDGFENFCIIDTPGINPGDEESKEHIIQTQSVLKDEADAAIILYTAKDTMSKNTSKFMEDNAVHLMGDAIVVLTKMDLAPEKEIPKIIKFTTRLIKEQFHQDVPCVYSISAGEAIEYITGRDRSKEAAEWSHAFDDTIQAIMSQLKSRRNAIVSSRMAVLLAKLIEQLSSCIEEENRTLLKEKNALDVASIQNLNDEFAIIYEEYSRELDLLVDSSHSSIENVVEQCVQDRCNKICSEISQATNRSRLNWCLNEYYKSIISGVDGEIVSKLNDGLMPRIDSLNQSYSEQVEECLTKYNKYLGRVDSRSVGVMSGMITSTAVSDTSGTESSFLGDHAALLAAAGVVMLAPGLNILILAGGFLWDAVRFDSKRDEAKKNVQSNLNDYKKKLIKSCNQSFSQMEQQNKDWANNLLSDYKKKYRIAFSQAEAAYNQHMADIEEKLETNNYNIDIMNSLKEKLANGE